MPEMDASCGDQHPRMQQGSGINRLQPTGAWSAYFSPTRRASAEQRARELDPLAEFHCQVLEHNIPYLGTTFVVWLQEQNSDSLRIATLDSLHRLVAMIPTRVIYPVDQLPHLVEIAPILTTQTIQAILPMNSFSQSFSPIPSLPVIFKTRDESAAEPGHQGD